MKFGIIAAGEGSRLMDEGMSIPKPLVRVNGVPMIERIIRVAKDTGFESVNCVINDHSASLKDFLKSNDFGIPLNLKVLSTPSSMHSLFELSEYLNDEYFCLSTSDSIFKKIEFSGFIDYARKKIQKLKSPKVEGILAVTKFIDDEKPLYVKKNRKNIIEGFGDNPLTPPGAKSATGLVTFPTTSEWVTGGIYFFSPRIFELVKTALDLNIKRLRNFLKLMLVEKYILEGYPFSKIIDVDHVSDIGKAEEFLREKGLAWSVLPWQNKL